MANYEAHPDGGVREKQEGQAEEPKAEQTVENQQTPANGSAPEETKTEEKTGEEAGSEESKDAEKSDEESDEKSDDESDEDEEGDE